MRSQPRGRRRTAAASDGWRRRRAGRQGQPPFVERAAGGETPIGRGSPAEGFGATTRGSDAIYSLLPPILVFNLLSRESMIDLEEAVRIGGAYHEDSGARALASRLIETLVILAAHRRVQEAPAKVHGWVGALLSDPRIGKALQLIHAEPASEWTVERLARQVGMSRTAFSQAFGERVGEAPMAYVLRWRMQVAIDLLRGGRATMTEVAPTRPATPPNRLSPRRFGAEVGVPPAAYAKAIAEANRDAQKLRAARLSAIPSGASKGEVQRELEKSALEFERLAPAAICSISFTTRRIRSFASAPRRRCRGPPTTGRSTVSSSVLRSARAARRSSAPTGDHPGHHDVRTLGGASAISPRATI